MLKIHFGLTFATAFLISVIITPIIKKIAIKLKIVDYPIFERKIHEKPVPLLGGLAIFLTFILLLLIYWQLREITDNKISNQFIIGIIFGGIILMIGGFLDDKFNLKPSQQFIFPVLATIFILFSGIRITYITNPLGGVLVIPTVLGLILTFSWLLGMMYTTKFLDGLDGLATGISLIGAIIIFVVSLYWDRPSSGTSILALILAGSCLGFLIYNFHPAKIFLGEGGSVFLGFILAVLSIISGSKIATALLVMGVPILDVAWVLYQRSKAKISIFKGDKRHLHFRLLDKGLSHRQAVIFLYFITGLFGFISLLLRTKGKIIVLVILFLVMVILVKFLLSDFKFKKRTI